MGYAHQIGRARNAANHGGAQTIFLEGDKTENWRFHLKANLLLPVIITLQALAISRSVTRRYSGDRASPLTQHHHMPIEVGQLDENVAFALRFYCVSKLSISPIVRHQPPPLILAFWMIRQNQFSKISLGGWRPSCKTAYLPVSQTSPVSKKAVLTASELFECA